MTETVISKNLFDPVRRMLAENLGRELGELMGENLPTVDALFEQFVDPPKADMGDLCFPCFILAKTRRLSPPEIAAIVSEKLARIPIVASAKAMGPYANITFNLEILGKLVFEPLLQNENGLAIFATYPKTLIEYSQPNTHKELHVGHMRNAALGNALVRILRFAGAEVITTTFPGDVGTHVAKCLWYLKNFYQGEIPTTGRGEWLGQIYTLATRKLENEKDTEHFERNKEELTVILHQLERRTGDYYELWKLTRQFSLDQMREIYAWAGIEFDRWYYESEVDSESVAFIKDLHRQGLIVESKGALGLDLSADNLGFCLLLKSDGTGLYATKDITLALKKFAEFHFERSIYIVDMRQALHFQQVFKVLERIGFAAAKNCLHLQYNFVELSTGAMSSREGNIVPLTKLIRQMEDTILERYLRRYDGEWTPDEQTEVASQVALGAIQFGMIRIEANKKIVFDMDEWLKLDGESGPFVQYAHARARTLLRKLLGDADGLNEPVPWAALELAPERSLAVKINQFKWVVQQAASILKPSVLCTYLVELAKAFNYFYHECPIKSESNEDIRFARLMITRATAAILAEGLGLLGIPAPDKM